MRRSSQEKRVGWKSAGAGLVVVGIELSVCSHYTDYTAPTTHNRSWGDYLVATLTLTYYTIN